MTDGSADKTVRIGTIVTAHGVEGEVKVRLDTDFPDRIVPGRLVQVAGRTARIAAARIAHGEALLRIDGVTNRGDAESLRGADLSVEITALPPLEPDHFYHHQLVGLHVQQADGNVLGTVSDILVTGANDVYVVTTPEGDLLIPAIEDVVLEIDPPHGRMVVQLMEGMEPVPPPKPKPDRSSHGRNQRSASRRTTASQGVSTP